MLASLFSFLQTDLEVFTAWLLRLLPKRVPTESAYGLSRSCPTIATYIALPSLQAAECKQAQTLRFNPIFHLQVIRWYAWV